MNTVKKIAMILTNPFDPDPRVLKESRSLSQNGYCVKVYAWDRKAKKPEYVEIDMIKVERINVKSTFGNPIRQIPGLIKFYLKVAIRLKREIPHVIHCHDIDTLPFGYIMSRLLHCKLIFDAHEPNYFALAKRFKRILMKLSLVLEKTLSVKADYVIVTNDYQYKKYKEFGVEKIEIVANYPEKKFIGSMPPGSAKKTVTIGRIGSMEPDAGIEEIISAYEFLSKYYNGLRLLLAGYPSKIYEKNIYKIINNLGDKVQFIPHYHYEELPLLYGNIDICIIPTKVTDWFKNITPTKYFEALCFRVPVITTDIGGIGEIVKKEKCGIILKEVTAGTIIEALKVLIQDKEKREEMGKNGLIAILNKYNWEISAQNLLKTYSTLI